MISASLFPALHPVTPAFMLMGERAFTHQGDTLEAVVPSACRFPVIMTSPQAQAGRGSKSFQPVLPVPQCRGREEPRVAPVLQRYVLCCDLRVTVLALLSKHGHRPPGMPHGLEELWPETMGHVDTRASAQGLGV